ncbi:hypothetical protein IZY60_05270 [Lutibacter sp. B2]|nr:hypothetical protein [Lutibacter sp. B2]
MKKKQSFFNKLRNDNILSDGMLSQIDETDLVNMIMTEQSSLSSFIPPDPHQDLAP